MSLELGYSTNLSVPAPAEEQEHYRPGQHQGRARTVRRVQPAEEPTESAARRVPVLEAPVERAREVRNQGTRESLDYWRSSEAPRSSQVNARAIAFFI